MKSYINTLVDYRKAPFEREVTIRCPEDHIVSQMRHLSRAFKQTVTPETLEKGDVVVLALESGLEKFNRSAVPVTVGGGLFDRELEEQLLGHSAGDTFEASVEGTPVKVTVKQATRTIFPEPTDEMAEAYAKEHEDFADCITVEAYRQQVTAQYLTEQRRNAFYDTLNAVVDYVLTHSDWEFDDAEVEAVLEQFRAEVNQQLAEQGKELSQLSGQELSNYFGVDSREEMEKLMQNEVECRIATALWLASIKGIDATSASLEELEEMEVYDWEFLETYIKENLKINE